MKRRAFIITFCLWHMFAVAAYNLPDNRSDWMKTLHSLSAPYVLTLSQWQKWDIFSPDPQRRSAVYRLETVSGTGAMIVKRIDADHLSWTERAKEFKILERLEADFGAVTTQYVTIECDAVPEAGGKDLRLVTEAVTLPDTLKSLRSVNSHPPSVTSQTIATVHCPPRS